jgi:hypothetical protein
LIQGLCGLGASAVKWRLRNYDSPKIVTRWSAFSHQGKLKQVLGLSWVKGHQGLVVDEEGRSTFSVGQLKWKVGRLKKR